ncbi:MAG: chloramphenicol acetyltransferase [Chitinophagales bacterium]|nr:chloramphenicol acetyltransferase [Chitinophagales bacterium]
MKILVDINKWKRREHFYFFSKFEEPFFGVTVQVDCTQAFLKAKEIQVSFFQYYLYRALKAANEIQNFRYRIIDNQVFEYQIINASSTVNRADLTFGFSYIHYSLDEYLFYQNASNEINRVRNSPNLMPLENGDDVIHFSALPWLNFTGLSHARSFSHPDSCPKISFGKMIDINGERKMSVSIHVHHALMDGYHVGLFVERFQDLLNQ